MEKIRVLMIDDNTSLVEMVKEYFTGHKKIEVTLTCSDGEEGLNTIINKSSEYDIILLDRRDKMRNIKLTIEYDGKEFNRMAKTT